ncbi:MAG: tetratricopeptide repeat protein, partial [Chthoniobacterales bacterium]
RLGRAGTEVAIPWDNARWRTPHATVPPVKSFKPGQRHALSPSHYLFATVLLVRIIVLLRLTSSPFLLPNSGDMHFYNEWAQRILHGQVNEHHAFYGLPLYPYLLACLYGLFGYSPFIPGFLQAILDGGTAVLLYKLAVKIFSNPAAPTRPAVDGKARLGVAEPESNARNFFNRYRGECIGLLAAFGWGFFLPEEAYSGILMPAAGLVFVFWFVVWQIVRRGDAPTSLGLLLLGVLIGFTAMGIATILFLAPLLLAALFFKWKWTGDTRNVWLAKGTAAALILTGIGIGASPCWIHNYFIARDPVFLSAHSGVNFWIGNNPLATGYPRFPPGLHAGQKAMLEDSITTAEKAAGRSLKRSEVSAYWSEKARAYIKNNFGAWLKLLFVKAGNFWNAFQYDDLSIITILRDQNVILPGLKFGLVAALALPGFLFALAKYPLSRWVAAAVLLHMASLLTVFVTERYRVAAVPGLLLGASFGLSELWQSCFRAKYFRAALYLILVLAATLFVSIPQKDPGLWALDAYNAGWQALQTNNQPLAEKKLKVAYAYAPENAEVNFALGNLRLAQGNNPAAESYYLATLRLDSNHEGAYNNLGILALEEKHWSRAAEFLAKAVQQDPGDSKTYYLIAQAQFHARDFQNASLAIARAIELDPAEPQFHLLSEEIQRAQTTESP